MSVREPSGPSLSFPRRCVSSRGSMLSTSSELNINREKMRKRKHVMTVTMEAEKADLPLESTVKAKPLTGRDYKSRFVKEALASEKSEKHTVSEKRHREEHVHTVSKKKRRLKKHLQCSADKIDSDIGKDTSNSDEGRSPILSGKLKIVNSKITLQQNLTLENESVGSDIGDDKLNEIQKKCDRRMRNLLQKQKEQIQEFEKVWEDKISEANKDRKLQAMVIRVIWGKCSETTNKLMILDDNFAKKEAENNFLKDKQLKELEAKQLAAREKESEKESEKEAKWLFDAKARISQKPKSSSKARSLGPHDEKGSGCSGSGTPILGVKDVVPLAGQHVENNNASRTVQEKHFVKSSNSDCAVAEDVGCSAFNENPSNAIQNSKECGISFSDRSIPAVVEQINQPNHFGDGECIRANQPASCEMQSLELHGDVAAELPESVVNEIVDNEPMDLSTNSPIEGFRERDAIDLPDALLNQRNEIDGTTVDDQDSAGQVLKTSKQTKASPHPCLPLLLEVQEDHDQGHVNSSPPEVVVSELVDTARNFGLNIETQDREEPATEIQSSVRTDTDTSKIIDTVIAVQSSINLQDQDALVILQKEVADSERFDTTASVANSELTQTLQSNIELQDQIEPAIETQSRSRIIVAASEKVDTAASVTNSELTQTLQLNIELPDQIEPAIETQSGSRIEVAASENMNNTRPALSSTTLQDLDAISGLADIATPVQSHVDGPEIENCEQLRLMPIDESPSCNQLPSIELESQSHSPGRIFSGAAETEMPLHGSTSQLREDVEPQSNNLDAGPGSQSSLEYICASFQNNVAFEIDILHQDVQQLGGIHLPIHEVAACNSPSPFANPFLNELERGSKEAEEMQKSHENTISCLKSECAKEIQELVAEIQNKYKLKLQDTQAQFILKKNELEQNQKKIMMNKLLADAFNNNSLNCLSTGPLIQQGYPSSSMQHQQLFTRPAVATSRPPASNLPISSLNGQAMQQIPAPPSTRPSQNYAAPFVQARLAAAISSFNARPGVMINANHPTTNPHFGGDIRSSAPHFQASVPAAPPPVSAATWSAFMRSYQQPRPTSSQYPQHLGYQPALSAFGLEHHPLQPGNHSFSIPEANSSFGSLQQSCFDTLGNAQGSQSSCAAAATNAIYLSDDD